MNSKNSFRDIHPNAKIGKNAQIGAFVSIEGDVEIGDNCWIAPNAVIMNGTRIGDNCKIFPGAVVGAIPQDLKYKGEETYLIIGDNVTIRECCTLNKGTIADGKTTVGDNTLLMAYVHVAHDCHIANNCILANNTTLAGHIHIGAHAILGGLTAVHQFVRIGAHCMVGGGSLVRKDIPPFITAAREPLSYVGVNSVGLRRRGFERATIHEIENIYRILFLQEKNTKKAIDIIAAEIKNSPIREEILAFVRTGSRGIIRGYRPTDEAESTMN